MSASAMPQTEAEKEFVASAISFNVPHGLIEGLMGHVLYGRPMGGFLSAVICNDLSGAVCRADVDSRLRLYDIVMFMNNGLVPAACWGSPENYGAWSKRLQEHRNRPAPGVR